jgi:CheY-like chemotaxis protein/DNA-directed RNA polymerase specialized sigma24 family protein
VSNSSAAVAQYLPFLRRYARALTGNQASGDAYVAATLEALIADRAVIEDPRGPRVALYRLFTKIWNSVSVNDAATPAEGVLPGEQKLANITPLPRQAFLLVALEGFSEPDAARVLDIDVMKLRGLVEESGRELAAEIATDVLIIEDDTFIAMELETLVEGLGHRVLGVARTHAEALALTKSKRPGLILADIQLADGSSGLEAVNELLASFEAPVIFITAYPERFLTGERPEPAFLIAKPFQPATVSAVASQALFFELAAPVAGALTAGAAWAVVASQADEDPHANRNCERDQRAMLDLVGQAAQRMVAELRCLAADFRRLIAHGVGPAAQSFGHAVQRRSNGLTDPVGGLRSARGGAAADALELPLQRTQALVDLTDFGGDHAGISRSRKHGFT